MKDSHFKLQREYLHVVNIMSGHYDNLKKYYELIILFDLFTTREQLEAATTGALNGENYSQRQ